MLQQRNSNATLSGAGAAAVVPNEQSDGEYGRQRLHHKRR
jgi:hypothetical protein